MDGRADYRNASGVMRAAQRRAGPRKARPLHRAEGADAETVASATVEGKDGPNAWAAVERTR